MSKFSKFIKDIVLPEEVGKERRKKILSEGLIETWQSEEQDRKAKEAKEAKEMARISLAELGLELLVKEEDRLPSLNAVKIPEGIDDLSIRNRLLNDYYIEIGGGLGPFAGKVWRIGLMGHSAREENVNTLLNALKEIL